MGWGSPKPRRGAARSRGGSADAPREGFGVLGAEGIGGARDERGEPEHNSPLINTGWGAQRGSPPGPDPAGFPGAPQPQNKHNEGTEERERGRQPEQRLLARSLRRAQQQSAWAGAEKKSSGSSPRSPSRSSAGAEGERKATVGPDVCTGRNHLRVLGTWQDEAASSTGRGFQRVSPAGHRAPSPPPRPPRPRPTHPCRSCQLPRAPRARARGSVAAARAPREAAAGRGCPSPAVPSPQGQGGPGGSVQDAPGATQPGQGPAKPRTAEIQTRGDPTGGFIHPAEPPGACARSPRTPRSPGAPRRLTSGCERLPSGSGG